MRNIDLNTFSMLHITFWFVWKLQHDAVTAPFGGTAAGQGQPTSAHIAATAARNDVTVPRVADTEMSSPEPTALSTEYPLATLNYPTICRSKHVVLFVTDINVVSKTERVCDMREGGEGYLSSGEETARATESVNVITHTTITAKQRHQI